jgi:hypothetical protein
VISTNFAILLEDSQNFLYDKTERKKTLEWGKGS